MAIISIDYESMRNEAAALRRDEEQIRSELSALKSRVSNLVASGFVTERSSAAFAQRVEDFGRSADVTISTLSDLAAQLEQIAERFAETDSSAFG
ncbi:MAG: WXG100 family type VII secretion target [Tetrasphaera sp.]